MKSRIRVGVLIFKKNKLLMVKHVNPLSGEEFWVSPGGGMKNTDKDIFACGIRESLEECGIEVKVSKKTRFIRTWYEEEKNRLQLEIFLLAKSYKGELSMENLAGKGADEAWIKELKFLSKKEMNSLNIFPKCLKNSKKLLKKCKNGAIYLD